MSNRLYVYLARRDKKGIKLISSFSNKTTCYPTKIDIKNISRTQLPAKIQEQILLEFQKNNLIYEIYIESAASTNDFRKSLTSRGYENIPLQQISLSINGDPHINENLLVTKKNTMIRKNSDQARRT